MKHIIVGILVWIFVKQTSAQTGNIELQPRNPHQQKLDYNIFLKRQADSSIVKMDIVSNGSTLKFERIHYGNYFIEVQHLHKILKTIPDIVVNSGVLELGVVEIMDAAHEIREVSIQAKKSILERKLDKLVYNVENTIVSPGDDAVATLQKAPGISVDQNGNVSMRGKSGVLVMINGKPSYLQGEQLNNLLKSTMADQISKIEIISNPSSKYDANGNGGIVNIILKKDKRRGTNGSLALSYGSGYYRKSNNSLNLNHRTDKLNIFGSYNFVNNIGFNDLRLYRQFYKEGQYQGAYQQNNYIVFPFYNHITKMGIDFTPGSKTILGITASGILNKFKPYGENKTFVEDANHMRQSYYTTVNRSKDRWYNLGANLNFKHTFDTIGRELTADADYIRFGNHTTQNFTTRYYDMSHNEINSPYLLLGNIEGALDIKAIKADYVHPFKDKSKMEFGFKSSFVKADNDLGFFNISSGQSIFDSTQSNHFIYHENINAVYGNYSFERKRSSVQIGLRMEQTIANGNQLINNTQFNRNYLQLFPSIFLNQKINEKHEAGFSFSRRIQRPSYEQLNPFKFFLDPSTYKEGNPFLVPQNTYLFELNHIFNQRITTTLSSGITNKSITEVLIPAEGQSNITIQTNKNVNRQYVHSLGISYPGKITEWWNCMADATIYYSEYEGELASQSINSATVSFYAKTMHTFKLPKEFTLQVDGFFQYAERYSFSTLSPFGAVNMSIQKWLWKKKVNMKLAANDLFYTSRFRGSSHFNNYHEDFYVQRDSRQVMMAVSYRFGNHSIAPSRRRTGGAEEEKQRAGKNV